MKKIITVLMVLICAYQISQEELILSTLIEQGIIKTDALLKSVSILLIYLIPLFLLAIYIAKKSNVNVVYLLLSFIFGGFLIGSFSGLLNFRITELLPSPISQSVWLPSIIPPIVEESLKLIVALLVTYIAGLKSLHSWMVVGLSTGLGFQFSEDYSYILSSFIEMDMRPLEQAFLRIQPAFATHWMLTAIFMGAVYICIHIKNTKKNIFTYILLVAPWGLHTAWNNPFIDHNTALKLILSVIGWVLLIYIYSIKDDKTKNLKIIE